MRFRVHTENVRSGVMANEKQIRQSLNENIEIMAKSLAKGKDLEIRKSVNGVTVAEVDKKVVVR